MTQTFSPEDTGEIQRPSVDTTQNLGPFIVNRPHLRRSDADTREVPLFVPATIGVVDGPLRPPAPSETGHLPLIIDAAFRRPAELGEYRLRRSVPYVLPADRRTWDRPRHRRPSALRSILTAAWAVIRDAAL